jgi:SAM-dependent methyltransferase
MLHWIRQQTSSGAIWPDIDYEVAPHRDLLHGLVLNAGAGRRSVAHLVRGRVISIDLPGDNNARDAGRVYATLDQLPLPDNAVDAVLCIAVLEHVANPAQVGRELARVLKPGGHLILSVPFLQPEHKVPTDFQRYTRDGLVRFTEQLGLEVISSAPLFTVYHTLHWMTYEWLHLRRTLLYKLLRVALLVPLAVAARRSTLSSDTLASVFQVIARKPLSGQ